MAEAKRVLIVDNDRDIAELARAILTDEGYEVSALYDVADDLIGAAVGRIEPDCVLLDGQGAADYGRSWDEAASLRRRGRPIPVIMFSAHAAAVDEARAGTSERAADAAFSGTIPKPFDLDDLVGAVAKAVGEAPPFQRGPAADARRTLALVQRLKEVGAAEVRSSSRREWVTFRGGRDTLLQLYWWQRGGCYYVGSYEGDGTTMRNLGCFFDLESAVACAETAVRTG